MQNQRPSGPCTTLVKGSDRVKEVSLSKRIHSETETVDRGQAGCFEADSKFPQSNSLCFGGADGGSGAPGPPLNRLFLCARRWAWHPTHVTPHSPH